MERARDRTLDQLLELDGETFFIDRDGEYRVNFRVVQVPVTATKPHGLDYSLTLHGPDNKRIIAFDNAHPPPSSTWANPFDHMHKGRRMQPYRYRNAAALLQAFWEAVDKIIVQRGIKT